MAAKKSVKKAGTAKVTKPAKTKAAAKAKVVAKAKGAKAQGAPKAKAKARVEPSQKAKPVTRAGKLAAKVAKFVEKMAAPAKAAEPATSGGVSEGDRAPSFALRDQDGNELRSDSLKGTPYVLYFYPKDDTPGCTTEACGFRDNARGFGKHKVRVLGVSPDSEASHARFAKKYGLPFTLLSDPEKKLAHAYGVWVEKQNYGRKYMGIQRSTFLVDGRGIVKKVYRGVRVPGHVEAVLEQAGSLG
jgi:peroxiredoxin Q/BCP